MEKALTDIMGTVVHTSFVKDLMNYFGQNGAGYIARASPQALEVIDRIKTEEKFETGEQVVNHILAQISKGNFRPDYLALTGMVTAQGYENGTLKAPFFDDVPEAFRRWKKNGKGIFVYSNGSSDEQRDIFRTSNKGDLTHLVDDFFGTDEVGSKYEPDSFKRVSERVQSNPADITFFSDILKELDAADKAGYEVLFVERPGNKPQDNQRYRAIKTFDGID